MRSSLVAAGLILLVLGIFFARERLKLAFKVGAVLYGLLFIGRIFLFARADADNLSDLLLVFSIFGALWLVAWGVITAIRRYQAR
ncbi:MAG: hypothetical protein U0821_18030 [Chloroflexota bacterium]